MPPAITTETYESLPDAGGLGLLARRIRDWTSRGLVSAIILGAGLAMGMEVTRWWASDGGVPAGQPAESVAGLADSAQPLLVEFGDCRWSFSRQVISCSPEKAMIALQARCGEIARRASPALPAPGEEERRLFRSIAGKKPVAEEQGRWALYELSEPLPMVVAIQSAEPASLAGDSHASAAPNGRVVAWSIGVPAGPDAWTLLTFSPSRSAAVEPARSFRWSLPPKCRRLFSLRAAGGGAMISFRGPSEADEWRAFFPAWLVQQGGKVVEVWRPYGATWHLRGVLSPDQSPIAVDVRFGPGGDGGLSGLIICTPSTSGDKGEPS